MIRSTTNHAILWRAVPHQDKLEREAAMMGQGRYMYVPAIPSPHGPVLGHVSVYQLPVGTVLTVLVGISPSMCSAEMLLGG